jgi:hypothetical protein
MSSADIRQSCMASSADSGNGASVPSSPMYGVISPRSMALRAAEYRSPETPAERPVASDEQLVEGIETNVYPPKFVQPLKYR